MAAESNDTTFGQGSTNISFDPLNVHATPRNTSKLASDFNKSNFDKSPRINEDTLDDIVRGESTPSAPRTQMKATIEDDDDDGIEMDDDNTDKIDDTHKVAINTSPPLRPRIHARAPSEGTISRLESLNVSKDTNEPELPKKGHFMPHPPKGEKRFRDGGNSSDDESTSRLRFRKHKIKDKPSNLVENTAGKTIDDLMEVDSKIIPLRSKFTLENPESNEKLKENETTIENVMDLDVNGQSTPGRSKFLKPINKVGPLSQDNKEANEETRKTPMDVDIVIEKPKFDLAASESDDETDEDINESDIEAAAQIQNQYEAIVASNATSTPKNPRKQLDNSDLNERPNKLSPIKTRPTPPPLAADIQSTTLRTSYKTDHSYKLNSSVERPHSASMMRNSRMDTLSERSFHSTGVLPLISTQQARKSNYLMGSMNSSSSLLGTEELERYFPDRKLRVLVGTWNMMELKSIDADISDFILPDTCEFVQDLYVIGTQESLSNSKEWAIKLQETIGPSHVLIHSAQLGVLYINIFIRRDLMWFCSAFEDDSISTRAGPSGIKTKGGVAISFNFFGTSLLFVSSHFTAHDGKVKERIKDFNTICSTLTLPRKVIINKNAPRAEDITARFDNVFWMGDLNFRLQLKKEPVIALVNGITSDEFPNFESLLSQDELTKARNDDLIFQHFQEGRINFKPTYKYDVGTDEYDSSPKMRTPSYTDRILYRSKKKHAISCLHYDSANSIKVSDHRPVYGLYEVSLKPGIDSIPLCAGQFDRDIYVEAMRRRATHLDTRKKSSKNSSVCSIQ
ncbi:unnamed protein product [Owenia fusiformis]|uniref:Inositol polyphosphate-related phosphatase domain-containing protein n=1 Tax=Owenia fusiformis TaxID=6347 RepID=A0A8S4P414_OWEFU|nr:unnamed protein product [Owenia fusiformis]